MASPTGALESSQSKGLGEQTDLSALIERKGLFRTLANHAKPPPDPPEKRRPVAGNDGASSQEVLTEGIDKQPDKANAPVSIDQGCTLTSAAAAIYNAIDTAHSSDDLDRLARLLWKGYGEGTITEDEVTLVDTYIGRRRPRTAAPSHSIVGRMASRIDSRFTPRQRPRSPDRKASRDRRRLLGGSSALPDSLRHHYTEGQRAVLCVIAGEIKRQGVCDSPIDKIAALAGVCRTTVQTTLHEARRLGHIIITERPRPGRKNLTNIVHISEPKWRAWLMRAPSPAHSIGSNSLGPLDRVQFFENGEHHEEHRFKKGSGNR